MAAFNQAVAPDAMSASTHCPRRRVGPPEGQPSSRTGPDPRHGPFVAYPVTCGITFTYGGLKIDSDARVIDVTGRPMPGLYATGEIAGDFFYFNYAAGTGLMRGAVFGRIAGANAAASRVRAPGEGLRSLVDMARCRVTGDRLARRHVWRVVTNGRSAPRCREKAWPCRPGWRQRRCA